jgi:hypothetical protein
MAISLAMMPAFCDHRHATVCALAHETRVNLKKAVAMPVAGVAFSGQQRGHLSSASMMRLSASVALGAKRTSRGRQNAQARSRMT